MKKLKHVHLMGTAALVLALLSACGGGGDATVSTPPGTGTSLTGTVVAPVDTQVVLQNNGGDNLNVTVPADATAPGNDYNEQAFTFATQMSSGVAYSVSMLTAPAGQTCSVYKGATGTMPVTSTTLKAGCEFTHDLVSRSSDSTVLSYNTTTFGQMIGGAAGAVASNATGWGEGRFVAFVSDMPNLAAGVSGSIRQVFWHDRYSGDTVLVSAAPNGAEGNATSGAVAISADGLTVVFESSATNLVAGDNNGVTDVFVWSVVAGNLPTSVTRASVSSAGVEGNAASFEPTVSGDGQVVAFSTYANNLAGTVAGTINSNVVLRDLANNVNTLVSAVTGTSNEGNFGSSRPTLSEDGTRLAFWSYASDLVAGDGNGIWDIFVYDTTNGLARVSLAAGGGERNQGGDGISSIASPAISGNGRYVAYPSWSTNVVAGDTNGFRDVFIVDTQTSGASLNVVRASVSSTGAQANGNSPIGQLDRVALSHDSTWAAFNTAATNLDAAATSSMNLVMRNMVTDEVRTVYAGGNWADYVSMSRTGSYVSFQSGTQALDTRFNSSGVYARFTGTGRAWAWAD